jgi:para-nitrobenzyl esterase
MSAFWDNPPMRKTLVLAVVVQAMLAVAAHGQVRDATVTGGRVSGVVTNGIAAFKGIPFAAPPVGELRWRAPQPVQAWTGVKAATTFAPGCIQDVGLAKLFGAPDAISEDCLYLNVWTPAKAVSERLPVMVWIYGGSFTGGMTSIPAYDGTPLAEKGVVLVSVAYRVGAFGFLSHPELSQESGKGSGNYGLQDQIAGLRWVKDNIARFGGDPNRVTIFGESAGGMSVSMLAASPLAKGLFHRAISQSGGHFGPARTGAIAGAASPPLKVAEGIGQVFLKSLGASDLAAARQLPAERIRAAGGPALQGAFWPVFDGDVLPGDQYQLYQAKRFNDTPLLVGWNSDEGMTFASGVTTRAALESLVRVAYGQHADRLLAVYPHATDAEATHSMRNLLRDTTFGWPTWAWAMLQSKHGRGEAWVYYFDHRTPLSPNGAGHAAEIPYVFRTLGTFTGPAAFVAPPRPEDYAMADLMSSYFVNFAKTGDPNGPGLPKWPAFTESAQTVMHFDAKSSARPVPNMTQIQAMDDYFAWRRGGAQ